jgi:hypothetical protein
MKIDVMHCKYIKIKYFIFIYRIIFKTLALNSENFLIIPSPDAILSQVELNMSIAVLKLVAPTGSRCVLTLDT